ncbi:putative lipid II flippase FtsW [Aurantivibrio plasticivorans]
MGVAVTKFEMPRITMPAYRDLDWLLIGAVVALMTVGILMVASASMSLSEVRTGNPWSMAAKHGVFLVVGLLAATAISMIPVSAWQSYGWLLLVLTIAVLLMVLIPGVGRRVNGAQRWLNAGPFTVQASELAKLMMIMFFASYLARRHDELKTTWAGVVKPLAVVCVVVLLLLLEPDFGGAVVIAGTVVAMMFFAGMKLWQFFSLMALGGSGLLVIAILSPYRLQRLVTFLDPWADQFNSGYQLTQSLIAFGQGQWFGVGLGRSVQKLFYLPDAHTDFIFAIIGEELGLFGAVFVIALFGLVVFRILMLSRRAMRQNNVFVSLAAFGIAILFAGQSFINMGVASSLLPTKGLTLPFISYGNNSVIVSCMLIGIVLRMDWEMLTQPVKDVSTKRAAQ